VGPSREKLIDQTAVVKAGVVEDQMNMPIATQSFSQVVQVGDEQLCIALRAGLAHQKLAGSPVQRAAQCSLAVVPGVRYCGRRDDTEVPAEE
jgi:hypothetical protein